MNQARTHLTSEHGFTLLELMIVVAIIGISVALAVPSYTTWNNQYQLRQAITDVTNSLTLSRMAAMNRNKLVTVTLNTVGSQVTLASTDTANVVILSSQTMPTSINNVVSVPPPPLAPNPVTVQFSPRGLRLTPSGAADQLILLSNTNGLQYSVLVRASGKVKWCPSSVCS